MTVLIPVAPGVVVNVIVKSLPTTLVVLSTPTEIVDVFLDTVTFLVVETLA